MEATFKKVSRSSSVIVKTLLFLARHLRVSNRPRLSFQLLYTFKPEALSLTSAQNMCTIQAAIDQNLVKRTSLLLPKVRRGRDN